MGWLLTSQSRPAGGRLSAMIGITDSCMRAFKQPPPTVRASVLPSLHVYSFLSASSLLILSTLTHSFVLAAFLPVTSTPGRVQWRNKVAVGPRASIPKGLSLIHISEPTRPY